MERTEWLKMVRAQTQALFDHLAPAYWSKFGFYDNATHRLFIEKFLSRMAPQSTILDAACGAGRYDGLLTDAGHDVLGIDQAGNMLIKAREKFPPEQFPHLRYEKIGLQEMDFEAQFDGAICIDALENIFPEDWPEIVASFHRALKPGGMFYATVEEADEDDLRQSYERARALGLPVMPGELADGIQAAYAKAMALDWQTITGEQAAPAAYHYYPSQEQVRNWLSQAGFTIEEVATGNGYAHFLARKAD